MADTKERAALSLPAEVALQGAERVVDVATQVGRWTPQATIQVICIVLLSGLLTGFGIMLWRFDDAAKIRDRDRRDEQQAQIREFNAREEISRAHCEAEAQKVRADNASLLRQFVEFQTVENAKFRAEVVSAIRAKGLP